MGCNKCTEVFYSECGYNDHLYCKHKTKNVSKYPPTILNNIWQQLPHYQRFSCPQCGTKFFENGALETHEYFCYKLGSKDKEARAKNLYERVEDFEKQKKLDEISDKKKTEADQEHQRRKKQWTLKENNETEITTEWEDE